VDLGGPRNHVLDEDPDPHGKVNFEGGRAGPFVMYREYHPCAVAMWPFVKLL